MMRLVFSDLRDHAATWIGAFLVAVGCGYIGGWAASKLLLKRSTSCAASVPS